EAHVRLAPDDRHGMGESALLAAFETLATGRHPCGAVCGTGFEDRPDLLARIAERWLLLGNSPHVVAEVKNPTVFAEQCRRCEIAHPAISLTPPEDPTDWVTKRIGGAGGTHIRVGARGAASGFYYQHHVQGVPVSALVLADGHSAVVLGFSMQ